MSSNIGGGKTFLKRVWLRKGDILAYVLVGSAVVFTVFPLYIMINSSFKPLGEIQSIPPTYWPKTFTLRNYEIVFKVGFLRYFLNSVVVSISSTFILMIISTLAAYALSRFSKFKGVSMLMVAMLALIILPATVTIIPLFLLWVKVGLIDTLTVLIITYAAINVPFCSLLLKGFFDTISISIEEAAWVDGASRLQSLYKIVLPITAPGLISVGFFGFVLSWQELLHAVIFINSSEKRTVVLGLSQFAGERFTDWGATMAGCTIAILPVILMFAFFEKQLVSGLTAGAIK